MSKEIGAVHYTVGAKIDPNASRSVDDLLKKLKSSGGSIGGSVEVPQLKVGSNATSSLEKAIREAIKRATVFTFDSRPATRGSHASMVQTPVAFRKSDWMLEQKAIELTRRAEASARAARISSRAEAEQEQIDRQKQRDIDIARKQHLQIQASQATIRPIAPPSDLQSSLEVAQEPKSPNSEWSRKMLAAKRAKKAAREAAEKAAEDTEQQAEVAAVRQAELFKAETLRRMASGKFNKKNFQALAGMTEGFRNRGLLRTSEENAQADRDAEVGRNRDNFIDGRANNRAAMLVERQKQEEARKAARNRANFRMGQMPIDSPGSPAPISPMAAAMGQSAANAHAANQGFGGIAARHQQALASAAANAAQQLVAQNIAAFMGNGPKPLGPTAPGGGLPWLSSVDGNMSLGEHRDLQERSARGSLLSNEITQQVGMFGHNRQMESANENVERLYRSGIAANDPALRTAQNELLNIEQQRVHLASRLSDIQNDVERQLDTQLSIQQKVNAEVMAARDLAIQANASPSAVDDVGETARRKAASKEIGGPIGIARAELDEVQSEQQKLRTFANTPEAVGSELEISDQGRRLGRLKALRTRKLELVRRRSQLEEIIEGSSTGRGTMRDRRDLSNTNVELDEIGTQINAANAGRSGASDDARKMGYRMQQASYGVQDFLQVLSGGGGLSNALNAANNNISQFFASAGGASAAYWSAGATVAVLGVAAAIKYFGEMAKNSTVQVQNFIDHLSMMKNVDQSSREMRKLALGAGEDGGFGSIGEAGDRGNDAAIDLTFQKKMLAAELRKEMMNKGSETGYNMGESIVGKDKDTSFSEMWSSIWQNNKPFGDDRELSGSSASKGVFDRYIKERFVEGKSDSGKGSVRDQGFNISDYAAKSMSGKDKGLFDSLRESKDLESALKAMSDAGSEVTPELHKLRMTIEQYQIEIEESRRQQSFARSRYDARHKFTSSDMSSFERGSGSFASKRMLEFSKDSNLSFRKMMDSKDAASRDSSRIDFRASADRLGSTATGGSFGTPAEALANQVEAAASPFLSAMASHAANIQEIGSPSRPTDASPEEQAAYDNKIKDKEASQKMLDRLALQKERAVGDVIKRQSLNPKVSGRMTGEGTSDYQARIIKESNDAIIRMRDFAAANKIGAASVKKYEAAINAATDMALRISASQKAFADRSLAADASGNDFENRRAQLDLDTAKREAEIRADADNRNNPAAMAAKIAQNQQAHDRNRVAIDADEAVRNAALRAEASGDTFHQRRNEVEADRIKKNATLQTPQQIALNNDAAARKQEMLNLEESRKQFRTKSGGASDMYSFIGGREAEKFQAKADLESRVSDIDAQLAAGGNTQEEKDALLKQRDMQERLYGARVEEIDRKKMGMTDTGSLWKQIQMSLKTDKSEKFQKDIASYTKIMADRLAGELNVTIKLAP